MNISLYPVRSGRSPAGAITDCFKDVERSMGVSGPRQGQGRVQGWQGGHSRRQTTPSQIAVAVSRDLRCPRACTLMIYQQQQHCAVLQSSDLPSLMHCTLRSFPRPLGRQKQKRYRPSHDKLTVASLGLSGDHSSDPTDI